MVINNLNRPYFYKVIFILIFEIQMLLLQPFNTSIEIGEVPEWPKGTVC